MITYKTWIIYQDDVNQDDLIWLKAFGISPILPEHEVREITYGNQTWHATGVRIKNFGAVTTTKKQEEMLVLKYGNCLLLHQVATVDDCPSVSVSYRSSI